MSKGKLVVFEGADGSGKSTQCSLLQSALKDRGLPCEVISFPRYGESFFGALAGKMLKGDLGEISSIPAHLAALPFACDRWLTKPQIDTWLSQGKIVIIDRYTASSAVYQAAKLPPQEQAEFIQWVYQMEYDVIGLPQEDVTLYLQVPITIAQELIEKKESRAYLGSQKKDVYEANISMQETVVQLYDNLSTSPNWRRIVCAPDGHMRTGGEIHKDIVDELTRNAVL